MVFERGRHVQQSPPSFSVVCRGTQFAQCDHGCGATKEAYLCSTDHPSMVVALAAGLPGQPASAKPPMESLLADPPRVSRMHLA